MHREVSPAGDVFERSRDLGLYFLTALLAFLIGRDLAPPALSWLGLTDTFGPLTREFLGYRFALLAAVIGGARVLFHSLEALFDGRLVADLAIAVACIAAILIGEPLVAAEVVFIGLVGECLEAYTFARAQRGIRKLVEVFPLRCWLLRDGQEVRVFTNEVHTGDLVIVKPGGKIPIDGIVRDGRSSVDASPLTGESLPVERGPGDPVLAGSINQFGQLTIETTKVAQQSVAGRVIELTARALKEKAPIERQADRLAKWFLPGVFGAALVVFLLNLVYQAGPFRSAELRLGLSAAARMSLYPTLGVLVVACPCALILATPAAVIAALGRLAGTGILVKSGAVFEKLASIKSFAFDKTGTLTEGRLELGDIATISGISEEEILRLAFDIEQGSEHPIGRLIVRAGIEKGWSPRSTIDFRAHPGGGVSAQVAGGSVIIGTRRLLEEQGVPLSSEALEILQRLDDAGQTSLIVARDDVAIGVIGARDRIRLDAGDVLQELRNAGIERITLLTGDRAGVANRVAGELKITDVHAELLPADKQARIAASLPVAFVGDGVNDAPALAGATVGIAVGSGTDVAAEAGDVITLGEPLRHLPLLVRLSRETIRIIRQNILFFAFGVNLVGVLLTGIIWPLFATAPDLFDKAPLVGVLYHQAGSLLVLLNSMRLLAFERAPSRALSRWRGHVADADLWLGRNLSIENLLDSLMHRAKGIALAIGLFGFLIWACSGLTVVEPDEAAVVDRFGRARADLGPGLHVRWPWLIETVRRVRPAEIQTVPIDFLPHQAEDETDRRAGDAGGTWTSSHGDGDRPLGASLFTGDRNLIDLRASVQFSIEQPRQYLYAVRQPRALIRSAAEGVLREIVAGRTLMDLLTGQRLDLQRQAAAQLETRLNQLVPGGIGVRIAGVVIHDLHPPVGVAREYYRLAQAIQEREQQRHRANAAATRIKSNAIENDLIARGAAERDARQNIEAARSESAALLGWQDARQRLSPAQERAVVKQFLMNRAAGQEWVEAALNADWHAFQLLDQRRRLIDFLLAWDSIAAFWKQHDKIFLDVDQVRGRLQLFAVPPELARPAIFPPRDP